MTMPTLFSEHFWPITRDPVSADRIALWAEDRSLTYSELGHRVKARCANLSACNLSSGDRIVLLQERTLELCIDLVAAICCGLSVTILSRSESVRVSIEKIRTIGAVRLIVDNRNIERAHAIAKETQTIVEQRSASAIESAFPEPVTPDASCEALIIFTSGSTGTPKGVALSQANIASNTFGLTQKIPVTPEDHYLHVMPLSHTNGVLNQILLPLAMGARVTLLSHFKPEDFIAALRVHKPTIFTAVPTILLRLLDFDIPKKAIDNLRFIRCGSAQLLPELHRRAEAHFGVKVLVSYGQTEITCTTTTNTPDLRKIGSVGVVLPLQKLTIMNTNSDNEVACGEVGEVCFQGTNIALEIIGQRKLNPDEWFRTGDCGYIDEDGYLFLTGRLKDIIIRGGNNLSPQQIEGVLLHHEGVRSVSVIGLSDDDLGEVPVACIEPTTNRSLNLADLNKLITESLTPAHQLSYFFEFDLLPQNATGKIDKKALLTQVLSKKDM